MPRSSAIKNALTIFTRALTSRNRPARNDRVTGAASRSTISPAYSSRTSRTALSTSCACEHTVAASLLDLRSLSPHPCLALRMGQVRTCRPEVRAPNFLLRGGLLLSTGPGGGGRDRHGDQELNQAARRRGSLGCFARL